MSSPPTPSLFSELNRDWQRLVEQSAGRLDQSFASGTPEVGAALEAFAEQHPGAERAVRDALLVELLSIAISHHPEWQGGVRPSLAQLREAFPAVEQRLDRLYPHLALHERLPERIGSYGLVEQLPVTSGQGTLAVCVEQRPGGRHAIIKFARNGTATADQIAAEAAILRHLNETPHPHVVGVLDAPRDALWTALVLPWLEGQTLRDRARLAADELARIGAAICAALEHVHARGYLHGDLSCGNILLAGNVTPGDEATPVLLDFGMAVRQEGGNWSRPHVTWRGVTRLYQAPEHQDESGGSRIDERTDLFQLAAVLTLKWFGLGADDFPEEPPDPQELRSRLAADSVLPETVRTGLLTALQTDPGERYSSAAKMGQQFQRAVRQADRRRWVKRSLLAACLLLIAAPFAWSLLPDDEAARGDESAAASAAAPTSAPAPQAEEALASGPLTVSISGADDLVFADIPAGQFRMGSAQPPPQADADELPEHDVIIEHPFYLSTTEVTVGQFQSFAKEAAHTTDAEAMLAALPPEARVLPWLTGDTITTWREPPFEQTAAHPVVNVTWNDAMAFCDWLSRKHGRRFRLPTEAEWEYACRGGTTSLYWFGDDGREAAEYGNIARTAGRDRFRQTAPVGLFPANPFGLHDMHGNVSEWCFDWYQPDYYAQSSTRNPIGPESGQFRVRRGGSYLSDPDAVRSSDRNGSRQNGPHEFVGFRVLCEIGPEPQVPVSQSDSAEPTVVGHWKVVERAGRIWQTPVIFRPNGTSNLGLETLDSRLEDGRFEILLEGDRKPSFFGMDDLNFEWEADLTSDRLTLTHNGNIEVVLERLLPD